MPALTCYRLHDVLGGRIPDDLDEYIDVEEQVPESYGPVDYGDFVAKLYMSIGVPQPPKWAWFVQDGFGRMVPHREENVGRSREPLLHIPETSSLGVALIVRLVPEGHTFAFTFGVTGRFLLKNEAWQRGYGLQTALNLMYPRIATGNSSGKLVAVDAKRRAGETIRSRQQASRATTFESFDVDKIRDLVGGATGEPYDHTWGKRITGADTLTFVTDNAFSELGKLCRDLREAHDRDDYKDRFAWLDSIRPIHDPELLSRIQEYLVGELLTGPIDNLELAPPEIIDWDQIVGFRYHFDAHKSFTRPELQIKVYRENLFYYEEDLDNINADYFRHKSIFALDGDGRTARRWPVWRCLTGEFEFNESAYVIDEGEIFEVSPDYLTDLNGGLSKLPLREDLAWPSATATMTEDSYNRAAASALVPALLMDKKLVKSRMQTSPVEVCDILTANRELIHVKLKLGSRDLSHLFSQGFVSATLLQSDSVFRDATHKKIKELGAGDAFDFFKVTSLRADDFVILYVIVAPWRGRGIVDALPFFSKINLLRTAEGLDNRGFKVALVRIDTTPKAGRSSRARTR